MPLRLTTMVVREFFIWWGGQLASLVPAALRSRAADTVRLAVIELLSPPLASPATVAVTLPRRGSLPPDHRTLVLTEAALPELRAMIGEPRRMRVCLRLPPGMLLQRDVVLPIAAERAPDEVVRYELDRLTPFRDDEVFWSCAIARRDRAQGRLHLRLTLAMKASLAPLLAVLAAAGIVPLQLEAPAAAFPVGPPAWRRITLATASGTSRRQPALRVAAGLCGVLAVAVVVVPFVRQSLALAATDAAMEAIRQDVADANALRSRMSAAAAGGDVMQAEHQRVGDPLQAIAAVTEALPDDTWLTDLTLHQRRLTLGGQSAAAVRLIGQL